MGASGYSTNPDAKDANKVRGRDYYDHMQQFKWKPEIQTPEKQPVEFDDFEVIEEAPLTPAEQAELEELEKWERENEQK